MQEKIRQLVGKNRLEEALELLAPYVPDEINVLQSRLKDLKRRETMGLLDYDEFSRKQSQIAASILELLKEAPSETPPANIPAAASATGSAQSHATASQAEGLQKQIDLTIARQNAVREALALAFDPNQRFAFEQQIAQMDRDIAELRSRLGGTPGTSPTTATTTPATQPSAPSKPDPQQGDSATATPPSSHTPAIYFSYAWGDGEETGESREEIVNQLYESLKKDGFNLKRDKMDLGYRGLISEFMREIGKSDLIVVVISDKYLRSPFCMHELNEIFRNSREEQAEFARRIFPIRAESLKMSDPHVLKTYLKHWAEEENKWADLVKDPELKKLGEGPLKQYVRIQKINENFGDLFVFLQDMNAMSKKLLAENDFAMVKDAIRQRMQELAE